ncbi:hypothetical protein GGI15_001161 [Coemansia interrupta]|uniref:Uncharacterized protein n=1 Tax=Coemansia interrupta TaxID=1126814 RepID=A0A9W8LLN4_9FUNG|nr:hypothetical protein GGI15_001161 [Coemansia interrupta]
MMYLPFAARLLVSALVASGTFAQYLLAPPAFAPGTIYYGAAGGARLGPGPGGLMLTGPGHGIIQGASTGGVIIRGPSGVIVAPPQSAGSIVF